MEDQNNEGQPQTATVVNPIIAEMQKELEAIDATQFPHAHRSLTEGKTVFYPPRVPPLFYPRTYP